MEGCSFIPTFGKVVHCSVHGFDFFFLIDWLVWGLEEREGTQRALKTPD